MNSGWIGWILVFVPWEEGDEDKPVRKGEVGGGDCGEE